MPNYNFEVKFLSCLCGSDLIDYMQKDLAKFLSCLCGSDLPGYLSKLPMRQ